LKIAIAADHAGWEDKTRLAGRLTQLGHEVEDFGTGSAESCDYPDYAAKAAKAVACGECNRGILICGTGIGMSLAANKIAGIRAAACQTVGAARLSRRHNDANVLCLGSRVTDGDAMMEITDVWLASEFEGGRHERRVEKIMALEQRGAC
jgi:ribose 5-phosphate isomerase B